MDKLRINKNRVEWDGGGLDLQIRALEAIRLGERVLVIHDYMAYPQGKPVPNLAAYSPNGDRLWTAENLGGLDESDAYVNFLSAEPLWVWNFACYRCRIDPETGKLLEKKFTK